MIPILYKLDNPYSEFHYFVERMMFYDAKYWWVVRLGPASYAAYMCGPDSYAYPNELPPNARFETPEEAEAKFIEWMEIHKENKAAKVGIKVGSLEISGDDLDAAAEVLRNNPEFRTWLNEQVK